MFSRVLKIHKSPPPLPPPPPGGPSGWLAAQVQALPARLHRTERSPAGALGNQRLILHSNRRLSRDKRPGNTWIFNTKTEVQVRGQGWKVSLSTELGPLEETFPRWSNQVVWLMLAAQIRFLIMRVSNNVSTQDALVQSSSALDQKSPVDECIHRSSE